jgi:uncharacterized protein YdcH (DUF465 family)
MLTGPAVQRALRFKRRFHLALCWRFEMARLPDERSKLLEKLRREHDRLDKQVEEFAGQRWLSPVDEAEVKRLKRLKLAKKDRMRVLGAEAR